MAGKPYKLVTRVPSGKGVELDTLLDTDGNVTLHNPLALGASYTWNTVMTGEVMDGLRAALSADRPVSEVDPSELFQADPNSAHAP
jgi:hypothetical protein